MKLGHLQRHRDCHTEEERDKQIWYINEYMWKLKNGKDGLICKAEIETEM